MTKSGAKVNIEAILKNWDSLNHALPVLSEAQLWKLLEAERAALRRRPQFLLRIYGRANKLRGKREREALFTTSSK